MGNQTRKYGAIVPVEWDCSTVERLGMKKIVAEVAKRDRQLFYKLAKPAGIDLELLEKAGYEYKGLSALAQWELKNLLGGIENEEGLKAEIQIYNPGTIADENDFEYVVDSCNAKGLAETFPETLKYFATHPDEMATVSVLPMNVVSLFIDEFQDEHTEARREVLKFYCGQFQSVSEYEQFLRRRFFQEWYQSNDSVEHRKEYLQTNREMLKLFRTLKENGSKLLQSTTLSNRKVTLSRKTGDILANMILMYLTHPYEKELDFNAESPRFSFYDVQRRYKILSVDDFKLRQLEADLHQLSKNADIDYEKQFYYLAYHAIPWRDGMSHTSRYIFLHRLAICFGHVIPSEYEDLTNGIDRKEIADRIRRILKSQTAADHGGTLLKQMLGE